MRADPLSSAFSSAIPHKTEFRQACATASRCGQCRGSCGNAGVHRDGATVAGSPGAGPAGSAGNQAAASIAAAAAAVIHTGTTGAAVIAVPSSVPGPQLPWLGERPWLWFYAAFVVLITAWTSFIVVAVRNQPVPVSIQNQHHPRP